MLQIANHTPFSASLSVFPDLEGVESAYAVVKATFEMDSSGLTLSRQHLSLLGADVFWGDPVKTSLRAAGEFGLPKPSTDILLTGSAVAPRPGTQVMDVSLRVGPVVKRVRVFGERRWYRAHASWKISEPAPFERMPLRWERAFGGIAAEQPDSPPEAEMRNPVGCGFASSAEKDFTDRPLPNLEDPAALLASPHDRPTPACFAPVAPTWLPRRAFAGTYDETWRKQRAPYLPLDFDPRYFQVAPPDLIAPAHLVGGEPVELAGCTVDGPLRFTLPVCTLHVSFEFKGRRIPAQPQLETVLIEPDMHRIQMLWRAGIRVDKHLLKLSRVIVECLEYSNASLEAANG
jgi:hypothetical protein